MLSLFYIFFNQLLKLSGSIILLLLTIVAYWSRKAPESIRLDISYIDGLIYTTKISVGTPPVEFEAAIDTAWADTWIPSVRCDDPDDIECSTRQLFDPVQSTTFQAGERKNIRSTHLFYDIKGDAARDTFSIGSAKIRGQWFTEAYSLMNNYATGYDTVLTLSRQLVQTSYSDLNSPSIFENLIDQKLLPGNNFALTLPRSAEEVGELLIGEDSAAGGLADMWIMPLSERQEHNGQFSGGWNIDAAGLMIDHHKTLQSEKQSLEFEMTGQAGFTTAMPHLQLSYSVIEAILNETDLIDETGRVDCDLRDELPIITIALRGPNGIVNKFSWNGMEYASSELRSPFIGSNDCFVMIGPNGAIDVDDDTMVIGSAWLRKFHVIFDHDKEYVSMIPRRALEDPYDLENAWHA